MAEEHMSRGAMQRFFRSELSGRDAHEIVRHLAGWGMHAEGIALWLLLQKAVRERRAESALFRQMVEYMSRAWHRPVRAQEN